MLCCHMEGGLGNLPVAQHITASSHSPAAVYSCCRAAANSVAPHSMRCFIHCGRCMAATTPQPEDPTAAHCMPQTPSVGLATRPKVPDSQAVHQCLSIYISNCQRRASISCLRNAFPLLHSDTWKSMPCCHQFGCCSLLRLGLNHYHAAVRSITHDGLAC